MPIPLRVRATYSVKGASERSRTFEIVIPDERADQLGTEMEIFLLYELVAEKIDAERELMLAHAEILRDVDPTEPEEVATAAEPLVPAEIAEA